MKLCNRCNKNKRNLFIFLVNNKYTCKDCIDFKRDIIKLDIIS